MLDAACPGEVFTSPTPDQMLEATKAVERRRRRRAHRQELHGRRDELRHGRRMGKGEDIEVETVLTNDDVAVEDSLYTAGRRGVGVTVLVEKICGGAAEDGRSLQEVAELGRRVNANGRSMGMALTPCITPASGNPSFELADDEVEIGIGIHGEPGRFREKIGPASQIAERLMTPILEDLPFSSRRSRARVRERHGRHAADRALRDVQRGGEDRPGARADDRAQPRSATTSPRSRCRAARSRWSSSTTRWSATGMRR